LLKIETTGKARERLFFVQQLLINKITLKLESPEFIHLRGRGVICGQLSGVLRPCVSEATQEVNVYVCVTKR